MSHTTIVTPERVCGDPITGSFGPDTVSTLPHAKQHLINLSSGARRHLFFGEMESILWTELKELDRSQVFGEEVCWVLIPINEEDFRELSLNYFPNVMIADVDMFGPFFGHWV